MKKTLIANVLFASFLLINGCAYHHHSKKHDCGDKGNKKEHCASCNHCENKSKDCDAQHSCGEAKAKDEKK